MVEHLVSTGPEFKLQYHYREKKKKKEKEISKSKILNSHTCIMQLS
jgi:hypothetical protein